MKMSHFIFSLCFIFMQLPGRSRFQIILSAFRLDTHFQPEDHDFYYVKHLGIHMPPYPGDQLATSCFQKGARWGRGTAFADRPDLGWSSNG